MTGKASNWSDNCLSWAKREQLKEKAFLCQRTCCPTLRPFILGEGHFLCWSSGYNVISSLLNRTLYFLSKIVLIFQIQLLCGITRGSRTFYQFRAPQWGAFDFFKVPPGQKRKYRNNLESVTNDLVTYIPDWWEVCMKGKESAS